jgi:competence protein ComEC
MKKIILIFVFIIISLIVANTYLTKKDLSFYVLDVGQGSSSLLITKQRQVILIDGGADAKAISELGKILPFYENTIDLLVITHSHDDHIGGLIDVFERYDVKTVIYNGTVDETLIYKKLTEAIASEQSQVLVAEAGQEVCFEKKIETSGCDLQLKILYPLKSLAPTKIKNPNDGSIGLIFQTQNNYIFITGDLEEKGETELVDYWSDKLKIKNEDNVIYVVGHHGSNTSSSEKLLDYIKPDYSVISVGLKNKFKHPSPLIVESLQAKSQIWRTDVNGTVKSIINNGQWLIEPYKLSFKNLFY